MGAGAGVAGAGAGSAAGDAAASAGTVVVACGSSTSIMIIGDVNLTLHFREIKFLSCQ